MRARLATLLALGALGILLALAGCGGGGDDPADGPSQSQDPIRLGTKNFTEQFSGSSEPLARSTTPRQPVVS